MTTTMLGIVVYFVTVVAGLWVWVRYGDYKDIPDGRVPYPRRHCGCDRR